MLHGVGQCLYDPVFPIGLSGIHYRHAAVFQYCGNVRLVKIYLVRIFNNVGNSQCRGGDDVVGFLEPFRYRAVFVCPGNLLVVENHYRVGRGQHVTQSVLCLVDAVFLFPTERHCNHADSQMSFFLCGFRNYGSSPGSCSAAHSGNDEYYAAVSE